MKYKNVQHKTLKFLLRTKDRIQWISVASVKLFSSLQTCKMHAIGAPYIDTILPYEFESFYKSCLYISEAKQLKWSI